jgi:hypothetical protein
MIVTLLVQLQDQQAGERGERQDHVGDHEDPVANERAVRGEADRRRHLADEQPWRHALGGSEVESDRGDDSPGTTYA